jgi:hypothetical protein
MEVVVYKLFPSHGVDTMIKISFISIKGGVHPLASPGDPLLDKVLNWSIEGSFIPLNSLKSNYLILITFMQ